MLRDLIYPRFSMAHLTAPCPSKAEQPEVRALTNINYHIADGNSINLPQ